MTIIGCLIEMGFPKDVAWKKPGPVNYNTGPSIVRRKPEIKLARDPRE